MHTHVQPHTGESSRKQKCYHDMKLSFEVYESGGSVNVLFPVRMVGCPIKFTPFLRAPFQILEKIYDVLYKVNYGRSKADMIHCDKTF